MHIIASQDASAVLAVSHADAVCFAAQATAQLSSLQLQLDAHDRSPGQSEFKVEIAEAQLEFTRRGKPSRFTQARIFT